MSDESQSLPTKGFPHSGAEVRDMLQLSRAAFAEVLREKLTAGVDYETGKNGRPALSDAGMERLRAALGLPATVPQPPAPVMAASPEKNAAAGTQRAWVKARVISAQVMNERIIVADVQGRGRATVNVRPEWRRLFRPGMEIEVKPDGNHFSTRKPRRPGHF